MKLFGTMTLDEQNRLSIGGCSVHTLAERFDTPLYVMDTAQLKEQCRKFKRSFTAPDLDTEVIYASKAFLNIAMVRLVQSEGLSLDVVSGGELHTAIAAGFPANRMSFHGNNKTVDELLMALDYGVHRIVVDNTDEIDRLSRLTAQLGKKQAVLLRVNPGIEAHTHEYIQTARNDSKFGVSIFQPDLCTIIHSIDASPNLELKGFHCHIGSQIFDDTPFYSAVSVMFGFLHKIHAECKFTATELNMGGGFGTYYADNDDPMDLEVCMIGMLEQARQEAARYDFPMPKLMIEPGRSIVANAGTTLYRVGGVKRTFGGRNFIFVDGGMTDNPRTALYDSCYEAHISPRGTNGTPDTFAVAGKCCESGDVVIRSIELPEPQVDDILAIRGTGAYNYSMSSNYNRIRRPAVVFVEDGSPKLAVRRESYDDLIRNDIR